MYTYDDDLKRFASEGATPLPASSVEGSVENQGANTAKKQQPFFNDCCFIEQMQITIRQPRVFRLFS